MKIAKRQLKKIIREETQYPGDIRDVGAAGEEIEAILNDLWDKGVDNAGLIALLQNIIKDIESGFVGEPT